MQTVATAMRDHYRSRKDPTATLARDFLGLESLGAVRARPHPNGFSPGILDSVNLDRPKTMTETKFFQFFKELSKRKRYLRPTV